MKDLDRLMRFVLELRQCGVTDARVLSAMERTPRGHFAPPHFAAVALEDRALPLSHGASMTKPSAMGAILSALRIEPSHHVLEIGTGSGYQAGVLGAMAARVISLERAPELAVQARQKIGQLRLMHVYVYLADGAFGWPSEAPFDRIIANAAAAEIPQAWIEQLAPGGMLIVPILAEETQNVMLYRKDGETLVAVGPVSKESFTALEEGLAPDAP